MVATRGCLALLAPHLVIDGFALTVATMMGLALGVDYALLMVSRFREELSAGREPLDAAALTRRTWATAQTSTGLLLHLEWWRGYYHFVRPHRGLRVALAQPRQRDGHRLPQRYRARTPAMAAGLIAPASGDTSANVKVL